MEKSTGGTELFPVDMNGDGIAEFNVRIRNASTCGGPWGAYYDDKDIALIGGSAVAAAGHERYVAGLAPGYMIDSNAYFPGPVSWPAGGRFMIYLYSGFPYNYGLNDNENAFIGVKFAIAGSNHYGWIRFGIDDIEDCPTRVVLKDLAYNTTPGAPIAAGETDLCEAPENLQALPNATGGVDLNWEHDQFSEEYQLKGKKVSASTYQMRTAGGTDLTIPFVPGGTDYMWQVRSRCIGGSVSPYSAVNTFTMPLAAKISGEEFIQQLGNTLRLEEDVDEISIYDLAGKLVFKQVDLEAGQTVQLTELGASLYVVSVVKQGYPESVHSRMIQLLE